jgi:hypothetical protein
MKNQTGACAGANEIGPESPGAVTARENACESAPLPPASQDAKPWEHQIDESARAFHAFTHFRDQPPSSRTLKLAYTLHIETCLGRSLTGRGQVAGLWRNWAERYRWAARVRAYDEHLDEQRRALYEREIAEMNARHIETAQMVMASGALAAREVMRRIAADPERFQRELGGVDIDDLLRLATTTARYIPSAAQMERFARGCEEELVVVQQRTVQASSMADLTGTDPDKLDALAEFTARLMGGGQEPGEQQP